jgi:hypothetical protein
VKTRIFVRGTVLFVSVMMLIIQMGLFYRMGIYVDEYGTSPSTVWGSDFWNYMNWFLLLFLFIMVLVNAVFFVVSFDKKNRISI